MDSTAIADAEDAECTAGPHQRSRMVVHRGVAGHGTSLLECRLAAVEEENAAIPGGVLAYYYPAYFMLACDSV